MNRTSHRPPRLLGKALSKWLAKYYLGPDHPSKLRLWNIANRLLGYPRLTVPFSKGWISLDIRDVLEFWVLRDGDYEPEVWSSLAQFATQDEVVWDIGGHVGIFAIKAACDTRVAQTYAFEPVPETYAALEANLKLNPDRKIAAFNTALGSKIEERELYMPAANNSGLNGFVHSSGVPTLTVDVTTVDDKIASGLRPPTLMKLDVEGWELEVLRGAERALANPAFKAIVFEAQVNAQGDIVDKALPDLLRQHGFDVARIERFPITPRENFIASRRQK